MSQPSPITTFENYLERVDLVGSSGAGATLFSCDLFDRALLDESLQTLFAALSLMLATRPIRSHPIFTVLWSVDSGIPTCQSALYSWFSPCEWASWALEQRWILYGRAAFPCAAGLASTVDSMSTVDVLLALPVLSVEMLGGSRETLHKSLTHSLLE